MLRPSPPRSYQTLVIKGQRELTSAEYSVFGAVAGAFTGLVTTPLDVLKTRMMLDVRGPLCFACCAAL